MPIRPPAFPAIRIDGDLYWDGGVLSNTPVEAVFDDKPRRSGLIFAVHMWGPNGPEPDSIWNVMGRHKDLQYASRAVSHIQRQRQIHQLRHIIAALVEKLPAGVRADPEVAAMAAYGCTTRMHVVRLLAPPLAGEDHSKDTDFSAHGIHARWKAGYADTKRALAEMPWSQECDRTVLTMRLRSRQKRGKPCCTDHFYLRYFPDLAVEAGDALTIAGRGEHLSNGMEWYPLHFKVPVSLDQAEVV
jgi:hypothetical protein